MHLRVLKIKLIVSYVLLSVFTLFYTGYLIHQIVKYWLNGITWHMHFFIYPYCIFLLSIILSPLYFFNKKRFKDVLEKVVLIFLGLFFVEVLLSITGFNKTFLEKNSNNYVSYRTSINKLYHTWPKNSLRCLTRDEYSFCQKSNSLGFIDFDWATLPDDTNKIKILSLGDSFTEGDGAHFDSSYVSRLRLLDKNDSLFFMNAGICGSDPFNNFVNFRDLLSQFNPDIILQTVSSADVLSDITIRGGLERFNSDGSINFKTHSLEPLFAISYVSRIFFSIIGYNELLIRQTISADGEKELNNSLKELVVSYDDLCRKKRNKLIFLLLPDKFELKSAKYNFNFTEFKEFSASKGVQVVDLMPLYLHYLAQNNLKVSDLYWKIDHHHNSLGYGIMAEIIYKNIIELN